MKNHNESVLVTGGLGFIGSHLVDAYLTHGYRVVVIDDLSSGSRDNLNPAIEGFYQYNFSDFEVLIHIFQKYDIKIVNHHAGLANINDSIKNPIKYSQINTENSLRLINFCSHKNIEKFIFASSGGAIYGEGENFSEGEILSKNPYAISKYTVDKYLEYYAKYCKFNYTSLRYSNVYGPRQKFTNEGGVVSIFCNAILKDEPINVYGDGTNSRDFIYVSDIVNANLYSTTVNNLRGIFNISSNKLILIKELISKIEKIANKKFKEINFKKPIRGDVTKNSLNNLKFKNTSVFWKPEIPMEVGIEKILKYLTSNDQ